ncbi:MAG: nicotinate-nucleotide--dimethylbenzimidazole phosphoribosyltransferase [Clostridia bacterium]|nr:nicotinate-nucleotide--dimethylbenzimidazole phosphoribosyltransferase [Clostridia bacterium]
MNPIISQALNAIEPLNEAAMAKAKARQAKLAKPPGSLGKLEALSIQLCGITGRLDCAFQRRRVLVFAADNGVVAEGVSSAPQSVTLAQAINISRGLTGVGVISRHFHAEREVIDVGIAYAGDIPGVRNEKLALGTNNLAKEPAMPRALAERALEIGIAAVKRALDESVEIIGIGEMGIGNTTTSSAVLSCLTGRSAVETVSRGGGINDDSLRRKIEIIDQALCEWKPNANDPIDVLSKVGGFDLCAMTGAFIGAAAYRIPVVIVGFISAVAALCAFRLQPLCAQYMIPSHASMEAGYAMAMEELHMEPILLLQMRLGEGSGCPFVFEIVSAGMDVLQHMATFEEASIDDEYLTEIRANERFQGGK